MDGDYPKEISEGFTGIPDIYRHCDCLDRKRARFTSTPGRQILEIDPASKTTREEHLSKN